MKQFNLHLTKAMGLLMPWVAFFSSHHLLLANNTIEPSPPAQVFDRLLTIVLENKEYDDAACDPYLKDLMKRGALLSNFNAITHPSYPNYLAMIAGRTFGIWTDIQKTIYGPTVVDLLESHNLTWKNYAENYPGHCFLKSDADRYARKHVPFLSFKSIQKDPERCAKVVNADEFSKDWSSRQVPNYMFYTPNLDNDGHDTNLTRATQWLKGFLEPLLADAEGMKGTLIEVTFDESGSFLERNQVLTLFIGPMVKPGSVTAREYNHYSVLKTIEDNFSLGTLGRQDASATAIQDIWIR